MSNKFSPGILSVDIIFLSPFYSDNEQATEVKQESQVHGIFKINETPVADAEVHIDDILYWRPSTNDSIYQDKGIRVPEFDGHNLPGSVYIYRRNSGSYSDTNDIVYLKQISRR